MLSELAFEQVGVDVIYIPGLADYNLRSRRAFARAGFRVVRTAPAPPGRKARVTFDLALTRAEYRALRAAAAPGPGP